MAGRNADHRGYFAYHHDHPPAPFNPKADPRAIERYRAVTSSMEKDRFYDNHTRQECKEEWARRYDLIVEEERGLSLRP